MTHGKESTMGPPPAPSEAELQAIRTELSNARGPAFWDRLEQLSATGPFQAFLRRWFPSQAERFGPEQARRDFLRTMGASLATVGLGACTRQPDETIVPFASRPESLVPGKPRFFATALPSLGGALGVLVESHMNRPTKVEGNPEHPASLGATDALAQASVLGLYDPDRSHSVVRAGQISTWDAFLTDLTTRAGGFEANGGRGLALLFEETSSPTLHAQLARLRERYPELGVFHWSPLHRDQARAGALLAFGRDVVTRYSFDQARVVLSLDADFLGSGEPGCAGVRHARDFATSRRGRADAAVMNRLYVAESSVGLTGAMADHRLALAPSRVEVFARLLAVELGLRSPSPVTQAAPERERAFARAVARDLSAHAGSGLVLAGACQSAVVHALAHRINAALKNVGATVEYAAPAHPWQDGALESVAALVRSIRAGEVDALVLVGGNPVYDAPADLDFREALREVAYRVHLASHVDETSSLCHWHLPQAHALESWSDARAFDGTATIVQPLIAPLYGGRTAHELLAVLSGNATPSPHALVREHWQTATGLAGEEFERFWLRALHDGTVPGTRSEAIEAALLPDSVGSWVPSTGLELAFRADAAVLDGRHANNGWLQEMPRPLTQLTWDNAALLSPATAQEHGVASGDVVTLAIGERRVDAPVWIAPGHPDGSLTLHLGYGRRSAGGLGTGVGFDAYRLRTTYDSWQADDVRLEKTRRRHAFASVQDHASMEGRDLVRVATFDRFRADPAVPSAEGKSLYPPYPYEGHAWGMVIDLNACIGCSACLVACQSENNIPVVGKEEVARGRELHWIRVDRYYEEADADVRVVHQPVPCMHCELAPCEVVCPVGATVHSAEGLNEMVYNRCVGTRYCSNNCPYKVRRFNFFGYADFETESLKLVNNPDVTVRSRGVMEKCTYCVQRISAARITAKKEDRPIADGEAVSACMQVCPTQAIVFGDVNDPASAVSRARSEPHHYALLEELGTRPRTTYLAKLRNPNPDLERS